ncbi:AraC-like ligand-binding domain-containing protein [Streptomyces melanogenes]|uniref:AraC-like ligand-binding domain-containing protein n=1 Tax=Streptomyces melanogenes TaxID=67326 RepID=UPI0037BDDDD8
MVFTEIDTAGLPPEHRFEWWRGIVEQGVAPTRISSDCARDFVGHVGFLPLGPAQVTTMAFSPITSDRPARLVRRSDPETFELTLILEGAMHVAQGRNETHLGAGDFAMWTSSRPYSGRAGGGPGGGLSRAIILHLPHSLVPLPRKRVEELLAHRMPAASGFGRVLAQYLRSVAQEASALDEADCTRLGAVSLDLATGFLAERIGTQERLPAETRHQLLLAAIDTFIDDNLADPQLNAGAVAARHNISVRHLHQLFRSRPETVSASIRRRRLERCYADLGTPALRSLPIRAVAARWGLVDPAWFSRAFRRTYGMTPGEHRSTTLGGTAALHADRQAPEIAARR